jgi:putative SOS response-associated peptidase YedK
MKDDQPLGFAGLWERWDRGEEPTDSCTIITTDANELAASIHDRMLVILNRADYDLWLDATMQDVKWLEPLLVPCASDAMVAYPVGTRVNSPANNDASCIEPVGLRGPCRRERRPLALVESSGLPLAAAPHWFTHFGFL